MTMNVNQNITNQLESALAILKGNDLLHPIEIDLILEKLRSAYEGVLIIKSSNECTDEQNILVKNIESEAGIKEKVKLEERESNIEAIQPSVPEYVIEIVEAIEPVIEKITIKNNDDDLLIRIDDSIEDKVLTQIDTNNSTSIFDKTTEINEIAPNVFEMNVSKTIHSQGESLASKFSHSKVSNLMSAMSFSDKLLFQRQLFKNNSEEFNRAIESINNLNDYDEAVNWLQSHYSWDINNQFVKKFFEIIQRRF